MRHRSRTAWLLAAPAAPAVLMLSAAAAPADPLFGTFTGTVTQIQDTWDIVPDTLEVGEAISGTFSYDPEKTASFSDLYPNVRAHFFVPGDLGMSVQCGEVSWSCSNAYNQIYLRDDETSGDFVEWIAGGTSPPDDFPFRLSTQLLTLAVEDFVPPCDLVTGLGVPVSIDMSRVEVAEGEISSFASSGAPWWRIFFSVESVTLDPAVPARTVSWGRIKALHR